MNDEFRQMVIDALKRGEELPRDWARELFPPEKREYELVYYGKDREEDILADTMAVPLQPASTFGKNGDANTWHNMLIFGDNLQVLKSLLKMKERGELMNADGTPGVRLIYIDPPFATKQEFRGTQDQKAYQDRIAGAEFLEFLRKRLVMLRELLSDDGALFVHLDWKKGHYTKILLDELLGEQNLRNEIIWKRTDSHKATQKLSAIHDTVFFYAKSDGHQPNQLFTEYSDSRLTKAYRHVDAVSGKRYRLDDLMAPGATASDYAWKGLKPRPGRHWAYTKEKMGQLEKEGRIIYNAAGVPKLKAYLEDAEGVPLSTIWTDIPMLKGGIEDASYPTQKPEKLAERIISLSSNPGDLVLDAFAGSGTTLAVAEKLGRRWIGIDCGKLAIYTIQKRMLNLKSEIGNKGKLLTPKPFTLYNAGLYDFATLRQLPRDDWRFFALNLFGCKDEPHTIGGLKLDGKLRGYSVLVFNHHEHPDKRIDEETIQDIHAAVGKRVGKKFFVIAPRAVFDFQQDYIDLDDVCYYALRIPYSVINELHSRNFAALRQPVDETDVNDIVDAWGFDFIQPPAVEWNISVKKRKGQMLDEACLKIKKFESRARIRGQEKLGGVDTFSMLMLDYDFDGQVFTLDAVFYAHQLQDDNWQAWFPVEEIGDKVMAVFLDIYGNEARHVIARKDLTGFSKPVRSRSKK
jgi:site-specific DNA-methyltransferase (adenine-specific)/adenine-specific DNA-methyltransferase